MTEVVYVALKVLHALSSTEDISFEVSKFDGIEQLMQCVRSKQFSEEVARMGVKVLYNLYSSEVLLL